MYLTKKLWCPKCGQPTYHVIVTYQTDLCSVSFVAYCSRLYCKYATKRNLDKKDFFELCADRYIWKGG